MSDVFSAERARLLALAYRMLGTPDEAEDIVQEAWIRWSCAAHDEIHTPAAWLTTVTARLAMDRLRSVRHRREIYVGPWLPEPVATDPASDPYEAAASAETLTLGFLTVLERLSPMERAVFLLHDVFGYRFAEIAEIVERSEVAARQIASRARQRVKAERPAAHHEPRDVEELTEAFLAAVFEGDVEALASRLTEDVVLVSDGGADHHAARLPVVGPSKVARFVTNLAKRIEPGTEVLQVRANGQRATYAAAARQPYLLAVPSFRGDQVAQLLVLVNPEKLVRFHQEVERMGKPWPERPGAEDASSPESGGLPRSRSRRITRRVPIR